MQTNLFRALMALAWLFVAPLAAQAQFETGKAYIGPHIGVGSYESSISYGGDFEYAATQPGEAGSGRIGIGATIDYWSWGGGTTSSWSYSWVPVGIFSAYHFNLSNRKVDLYAGLGLGYTVVNAKWQGEGSAPNSSSYTSGIYLNLVGGVRYFFSPNFAANARVGLGASVLSVGMNFGI